MGLHEFGHRAAILQNLSADERAVRRAAFHLVLARMPASVPNIAERASLAPPSVFQAIARLTTLGLLECGEDGEVMGSWGLTQRVTPFELRMAGAEYHTWCAEDAVGIPVALGIDAMVSSRCFQCGQAIAIGIDRGAIARSTPPGIHLWLAEAQIGSSMVGGT